MADYNATVALGIQPPDPNNTFNSLAKILGNASGILGVRQQQQALQTGQFAQQSAKAKATVDTQSANENQARAQLLSDPVKNGIVDENGNPTPDAQKIVMRAAPTTGQDHYEKILNAANTKVQFNSAVNTLRAQDRAELAQAAGGVAARAQSPQDIADSLDQVVESKQGTPEYGNYQTIAGTMKQAIGHLAAKTAANNPVPAGQEPWRIGAQNMAASILPAGASVGAGGLGTPEAVQTGAGLVNRSRVSGALSQPAGAHTGSAINPTPVQVAGATAGATSRAGGAGNADIEASNQVVAAQRDAKANIDLTRRIDQIADVIQPGKLAGKVSAGLNALGFSDVNQARSELQKDLGRLRGNLAGRAGSDSRAATALEGLPTDTTPAPTIHQAMDITRGMARQDLALGSLRAKAEKATGGTMTGFQGDYAHAVGAASPLMHEYYALSPAEQVGFFKRNFQTKEQAKAFRAQAESVKRLSPDVTGQ